MGRRSSIKKPRQLELIHEASPAKNSKESVISRTITPMPPTSTSSGTSVNSFATRWDQTRSSLAAEAVPTTCCKRVASESTLLDCFVGRMSLERTPNAFTSVAPLSDPSTRQRVCREKTLPSARHIESNSRNCYKRKAEAKLTQVESARLAVDSPQNASLIAASPSDVVCSFDDNNNSTERCYQCTTCGPCDSNCAKLLASRCAGNNCLVSQRVACKLPRLSKCSSYKTAISNGSRPCVKDKFQRSHCNEAESYRGLESGSNYPISELPGEKSKLPLSSSSDSTNSESKVKKEVRSGAQVHLPSEPADEKVEELPFFAFDQFSTFEKKPPFVLLLEQQRQQQEEHKKGLESNSSHKESECDKQQPKQYSSKCTDINKYQLLLSAANETTSTSNRARQFAASGQDAKASLVQSNSPDEQGLDQETPRWSRLDWRGVARRYSEMPRQHRGQLWWNMRNSCLCHLIFSTLNSLFPILTSFNNYSLPKDLMSDLMAGFTIAVLHIPQGMAYGMLSGVEPIYGLYVSFIPVLVMAFMSRSYHVSYGTFAVISMLLTNSIEKVKSILLQQHQNALLVTTRNASDSLVASMSSDPDALILTDNHKPNDPTKEMLRSLLNPLQQHNITTTVTPLSLAASPLDSASTLVGVDFVMPSNIEILTSICLLTGLLQIIMGLSRLGILSLMFSDQLISGFTTSSAINVLTTQVSNLFDITLPHVPEGLFRIFRIWWAFGLRLAEGFNQYTALLSLFSFTFLLLVKEIIEPPLRRRFKSLTCLPSELILMSFLIFSSWYWQFETVYGISIVGHVPTGLPAPKAPRLDIVPLIMDDVLTIAVVSFAMNFSLATVYAKKFRYKLNPNQELVAMGTSNCIGSFFSCFPCASSLSRSAIQSSLNVKSQLCTLFSCAIVVLIVCYFAPILHDLPRSVLSCIIIVALKGILMHLKDLYTNWTQSKLDAFVWIITFSSVLILGITYGLVVGIFASLFMVFFRLLTPNHSILGQLPGTEIFVDRDAFTDCKELDQVKIFRFNSALCYLNRTMFKSAVEKSLPEVFQKPQGFAMFCSKKKQNQGASNTKYLIIDCSALAYCDFSGAATLVEIVEELDQHSLTVFLAACPLKLINMFEKMQNSSILEQNVYPTITDAINYTKYLIRRSSQSFSDSTGDDTYLQSVISCKR